MATIVDSQELREVFDRFVHDHIVEEPSVVAARLLQDERGVFISVRVEPGRQAQLPEEFEGLRVLQGTRRPGQVAAGQLR